MEAMGWSLMTIHANVEILWREKNEANKKNNRNKWAFGERGSERETDSLGSSIILFGCISQDSRK